MSQTSSSYPSFNDDGTDSTYVTEYYAVDDHHDTEDGGYEDGYNEFEDYDGEWIDMSDIPEDLTFEEPELACILEYFQKGRKGSGKYHRKGKKGFSKGELRDKEGGKGNRPENYWQVQLKLQCDRLNRGWRDQPTRATYKGRNRPQFAQVGDFLTRTRCFKCGALEHLARNCSQKKKDDPSLFSGDKETATESETFFSGMACDDSNVEAVFAAKEETLLLDSNVDEKEETLLLDSNVEEKKETFLRNTISEKKEEIILVPSKRDLRRQKRNCSIFRLRLESCLPTRVLCWSRSSRVPGVC